MLKDVSREEASRVTRIGQVSALALVVLAGGVIVMGGKFLRPADPAPSAAAETPKPELIAPQGDLPAVLTKRAESISRNLAQLGNAPKPPPPPPPPDLDVESGEIADPVAPEQVADVQIAYLGMFGSSASPMALISVDSKQQIVGSGQTLKHNDNVFKIGKITREKIEIERQNAARVVATTVDLAPRSTSSYTSLSGGNPPPIPSVGNTMPQPPGRRPPVAETMRAPGARARPPMPDGIPPGSLNDEGAPQR